MGRQTTACRSARRPGQLREAGSGMAGIINRRGCCFAFRKECLMDARPIKKPLLFLLASVLTITMLPCLPAPAPVSYRAAQVSVDWGATKAYTTPLLFGSNDWAVIGNPESTLGDDRFARSMAQTGIRFIRLHNAGFEQCLDVTLRQKPGTWRKSRRSTMRRYLQGKTILQNIPTWAPWMKTTDGSAGPLGIRRLCGILRGLW